MEPLAWEAVLTAGTFFILGATSPGPSLMVVLRNTLIGGRRQGVACAVGMGICSGMGWTQKAVICAQGVGVCSGATTGLHEGDPANPATVPGKVAGDAASAAFGQFSA